MYLAYDLLTTAVVVIEVIVVLVALGLWFKSKDRSLKSMLWFLVILFVPIVGPLVFLGVHLAKRPSSSELG